MRKIIFVLLFSFIGNLFADPLPSWNEGNTKKSIIDFVQAVTNKSNPNYVTPENRIATIDNDGTLWVEQPLYTQFIFAIDRVKTLAPSHPDWKKQSPFSLILSGDKQLLSKLSFKDMEQILAVTHAGISVEQYHDLAAKWLATAKNPRFQHLFTEDVYQPMLEVMNYLRANQFIIYIVSGGGQDFIRAYAEPVYHVQPENVIGTLEKTKYVNQQNHPMIMKLPTVLLIDDKTGKAEAINYFIGRKPIIAFGNSDGDREMLEWTQSNKTSHLMLLVHHDDAVREYAYGPKSKVGTFSDSLMAEAIKNNWKIISMKKDWKVIFPFDLNKN